MSKTKVEIEPAVDKNEWQTFLSSHLQPLIEQAAAKGAPEGQYVVMTQFIVHKDGHISDVKALKDPGFGLGESVVKIMKDKDVPKWKPGIQNGKPVNAYHNQPVTFVIQAQ